MFFSMLLAHTRIDIIHKFVEVPNTVPHLSTRCSLNKNPIATTTLPIPAKTTSISLEKCPKAVHLIMQELSLKTLPVLPPHDAIPTFLVVLPFTVVTILTRPKVLPMAVQLVFDKISAVETDPILEDELSVAIFLATRPFT